MESEPSSDAKAKAEAAVAGKRLVLIWRNPKIYVFIGEHGDYIIINRYYCSCPAFIRGVMQGNPVCYHIYAVALAEESGRYHDVSEALREGDVEEIVFEILGSGVSSTLRRILFDE